MTIPVPVLAPAGWITSPAEKADSLLTYCFETNYSQTYLYLGKITSIQYIIEQNAGDINSLVINLRNSLEVFFGRYYDSVIVDVTYTVDKNDISNITLRLNCLVTDNGVQYSLGRLLTVSGSKISKVINLNNNTQTI